MVNNIRRRSPHGERGLKYSGAEENERVEMSLPSRGAWIEIPVSRQPGGRRLSLPSRGAWIEI